METTLKGNFCIFPSLTNYCLTLAPEEQVKEEIRFFAIGFFKSGNL